MMMLSWERLTEIQRDKAAVIYLRLFEAGEIDVSMEESVWEIRKGLVCDPDDETLNQRTDP